MRFCFFIFFLALAACKPPPTDADMRRDMPEAEVVFASAPLPSPETEGAIWAHAPLEARERRVIYGVPGQPVLVVLECFATSAKRGPDLTITRHSPADKDASALLALVGNGHIGRIPVEASEVGGRSVWEGYLPSADVVWEPLAGPRSVTLTVPGAGMVELNPSPLPGELIEACRTGEEFVPSTVIAEEEPETTDLEVEPDADPEQPSQ